MDQEEAKKKLSPEQYNVCVLNGTEPPGSGKWLNNKASGTYGCVNCGQELFKSDTKFESETGWPSFWDPAVPANVKTEEDKSMGVTRTEVLCSRCDANLGHVLDDGPPPTGQRYCINSLALDFRPTHDRGPS